MVNKNDLRYVKTENLIRSVYIGLLKKQKRPVTATELCSTALINKSTFYAHYETIDQLRDTIRQEKIHEMMSEEHPDILKFFTDTRACFSCIFSIFYENMDELNLLFSNWTDMIGPLEKELLARYESLRITEDQKCALRFCIGGILHLIS